MPRALSKAVRRRRLPFDRPHLADVQASQILRKPDIGPPGTGRRNGVEWLSPTKRRHVASRLRKAEALLRQFWKHDSNDGRLVAEAAEYLKGAIQELVPR